MLPAELLTGRYNGEEFAPTRLPLAADTIDIFALYVGKKRLELDEQLLVLEGAGVKVQETPAKVAWFKGKINPKDVLRVLEPVSA